MWSKQTVHCPDCGKDFEVSNIARVGALLFFAALAAIAFVFPFFPALSALSLFFINIAIISTAPAKRCPACNSKKEKTMRIYSIEFIFDSFMFYLPLFMVVNSLNPIVDDLFFIALFALFWAAGFAYKFLPAGFVYRFLPKPKKKEKELKETIKELPPKEVKASILDKSGTFLRKYVCSNCGTELDNESVKKCPNCNAVLEKFVPQN